MRERYAIKTKRKIDGSSTKKEKEKEKEKPS